jgi:acyl-coenzyme A thioesterase PaaI-like protein
VLCDALGGAGEDAAGGWAKELRDLSTALAVLDTILRKQNVHVQLNIEHLRKHILPIE